jgi:hypothetical protein
MTHRVSIYFSQQYSDNLSAVSTRGSESKAAEGIYRIEKLAEDISLNKEHQFVPDGKKLRYSAKRFSNGIGRQIFGFCKCMDDGAGFLRMKAKKSG